MVNFEPGFDAGAGGSAGHAGTSGSGGSGGTAGTSTGGFGGEAGATGGAGGSGGWGETGGFGEVGGSGGSAGWGGQGGAIPTCVPGQSIACTCPNGRPGAQVCARDGTYDACVCDPNGGDWEQQRLAWLRSSIIGTWVGTQTNPWTSPCSSTLTFDSTNHYTGHSPGDACLVFYYGSNDDSPEKTYSVDDVQANGDGSGELALYFGLGNTNRADLRHITMSEDGSALRFECWNGSYGPLVFSLKRNDSR